MLSIVFMIELSVIGQCFEGNNIKTSHWKYSQKEVTNASYCYLKGEKQSGYVDIMVKVNHEQIRYVGGVFIFTRNGNFTKPLFKVKKNGFCVVRIYLNETELWQCMDKGITRIDLLTEKNHHTFIVYSEFNRELQELKEYCKLK